MNPDNDTERGVELEDLFQDKEKENQLADERHRLVEAQNEARRRSSVSSSKIKQDLQVPSDEEDYTGFVSEQEAKEAISHVQGPEEEPEDATRIARAAEKSAQVDELFNDDYDQTFDYDYDAQETTTVPSQAIGGGIGADRGISRDTGRGGGENGEEKQRRVMLYIIIGMVIAILMITIMILLIGGSGGHHNSSESSEESSEVKDIQKLTGVVTSLNKSAGTIVVYNADTRTETAFLASSASQPVSLSSFQVGDIVDVTYDMNHDNALEGVTTSQNVTELNDVTGVIFGGTTVSIDQTLYSVDSQLICTYEGQPFDKASISASSVFNAHAVGSHIYTVEVTQASTSLIIENLDGYVKGKITVTPADGESVTQEITASEMSFDVPEGSVSVVILSAEGEQVYSGKTFATFDTENRLRVPDPEAKTGKIEFSVNVEPGSSVTIEVNGQSYQAGVSAEFEYGDYTLTAKCEGYEDLTQKFTVSKPYEMVRLEMQQILVHLFLNISPVSSAVTIDGEYVGSSSAASMVVTLSAGAHTIQISQTGYETLTQTVDITKDLDYSTIQFRLTKLPEPEESSEESSSAESSSQASSETSEASSEESSVESSEVSPVESSEPAPAESSEASPEESPAPSEG